MAMPTGRHVAAAGMLSTGARQPWRLALGHTQTGELRQDARHSLPAAAKPLDMGSRMAQLLATVTRIACRGYLARRFSISLL